MVRDFGFIVIPKNYTFPSFQPCLYFDPQLYYTSDRCGIYIVRIVKTLLPISIRVHTSQKTHHSQCDFLFIIRTVYRYVTEKSLPACTVVQLLLYTFQTDRWVLTWFQLKVNHSKPKSLRHIRKHLWNTTWFILNYSTTTTILR